MAGGMFPGMFQRKQLDTQARYEKAASLQQAIIVILKAPPNRQRIFFVAITLNKVIFELTYFFSFAKYPAR